MKMNHSNFQLVIIKLFNFIEMLIILCSTLMKVLAESERNFVYGKF